MENYCCEGDLQKADDDVEISAHVTSHGKDVRENHLRRNIETLKH